MIDRKNITIIIPSLVTPNRSAIALKECIVSLRESGFPTDHIIIATNGSDTYPLPMETPNNTRRIHNYDQGQCMAVNAAVAVTNTEWIMVSNDDMVFPQDWYEKLTRDIPSTFATYSPQLIEPRDGAPTFKKVFCGGIGGDWNKQAFMDYAQFHVGGGLRSGFNLPYLIHRTVWDLVGGYDINYDPWGSNSDSDLEYKLKLAGVEMYQQTDCPVYHFSNTSDTFTPKNRPYWEKNWNYFIEKWGFPRTDDGIWEATFEIPFDRLKFKPNWMNVNHSR